MASKVNEAYSNGKVVAIKNVSGGYNYYVTTATTVGGQALRNDPVVAREISIINLEIMDLKTER